MECAARLLQETRVLMAAHQSGISSALGLTSSLACDQRMFHFVDHKTGTGTVAASKTLSAAAVLFNARPAASANRSMGSLCPREGREKGQSTREGREGSFDKMDNSLRAGWSMAAITPGEACMYKFEPVECPSLQSQPSEFLNKGKEGKRDFKISSLRNQ